MQLIARVKYLLATWATNIAIVVKLIYALLTEPLLTLLALSWPKYHIVATWTDELRINLIRVVFLDKLLNRNHS